MVSAEGLHGQKKEGSMLFCNMLPSFFRTDDF